MPATAAPPLLPVFRSQLQGEILALVLGDPAGQWSVSQLADRTGQPRQTVANEIRRLERVSLLSSRAIGRAKLLRANTSNPYFGPLSQLAVMSFGPTTVVAEEFAAIASVEQLFIFGSWAARYAGEDGRAPNDIDVMLIGTPDRGDVYEAELRAERRLGREVHATIRRPAQWAAAADGFIKAVQSSPLVEIPLSGVSGSVGPENAVARPDPIQVLLDRQAAGGEPAAQAR